MKLPYGWELTLLLKQFSKIQLSNLTQKHDFVIYCNTFQNDRQWKTENGKQRNGKESSQKVVKPIGF